MNLFPEIKGIAVSLITSACLLIIALVVALASIFYNATIYPLAAVVIGIVVVMFFTILSYDKNKKLTPVPNEAT